VKSDGRLSRDIIKYVICLMRVRDRPIATPPHPSATDAARCSNFDGQIDDDDDVQCLYYYHYYQLLVLHARCRTLTCNDNYRTVQRLDQLGLSRVYRIINTFKVQVCTQY